MKKNMMKLAFAAALAVAAGVTAYQAQEKEMMSDLTMENVEALASGEGDFGMCVSARHQTCQYFVVTPSGNHVEIHYEKRLSY